MLAGAVEKLCEELTATQTVFPTTKLRLVYQLAGAERHGVRGVEAGESSAKMPELDD